MGAWRSTARIRRDPVVNRCYEPHAPTIRAPRVRFGHPK